MIKEVVFVKKDDFASKEIKIDFDKNVNVIIGPKGGGKSTLFDLLAGLKNNYISDNVIKALDENNLEFVKATKFSNEEILFSQLSKKKKKDKEIDYETRNDVIYQDDVIKKDLTSSSDIEKMKFDYLKEQISHSENIDKNIKELKNLYLSMNKVHQYSKSNVIDINWTNTFKMNDLTGKDELSLITKLDYKSLNLSRNLNEELSEYIKYSQDIDSFNQKLNRIKITDKNKIVVDLEFNNQIDQSVDKIVESNNQLKKLLNTRILLLKKIENLSKCFSQSYKKVIEKIKSENYSTSGLKSYETKARNHFRDFAKDVFELIVAFEKTIGHEMILNIENNKFQSGPLTFHIPENMKLSDEGKHKVLKVFFHSPGSSVEDVDKWLKSLANKGVKEFDEDKIKNCIAREIKDDVKILVDFNGKKKEYKELSLGQRSIYGLKYKISRSLDDDIFLDQPEDNLDNHTIAEEVLDIFEQKKSNQVFVVTHNANIGILSNPGRVIVADITNFEGKEPYRITTLKQAIEEQAWYLEGGQKYLERRYKKVFENEGDK